MDRVDTPPRSLAVPKVASAPYSRNFIRLAVCEMRFPTLFEVESDVPPLAFSRALRKEYPTHELLRNVNVNLGGLGQSNAHAFRSRKARWTVHLRAAALSLETSAYTSFAEFAERLSFVLRAASATIDADFFTRVGLRYINAIPCDLEATAEWVNPALSAPLAGGVYGTVSECWQRIQGPTAVGGYAFQHGVQPPQAGTTGREYLLDFDFFREDVATTDANEVVKELHEHAFSMFMWSLGPRAKKHLEGP